MNQTKWIAVSCVITISVVNYSVSYAKLIYPAEILGRQLGYIGIGWMGHVGISTTDLSSPKDMTKNADQVIEILNKNPVGQINSIENFKKKTKYWGSRYGIADRGERAYKVLVEANTQRWLCPSYTFSTKYNVGKMDPDTGVITECGKWRCDTFVWWAFYSQGWDLSPQRIWLPTILYHNFPYINDENILTPPENQLHTPNYRTLHDVTTDELNAMPFNEFSKIMEQKSFRLAPAISPEMHFAYDDKLNDKKRGVMIDHLLDQHEPQVIENLVQLYNHTNRSRIKNKILEGLMLYNQQQNNIQSMMKNDKILLKKFFFKLLHSNLLDSKGTAAAVRGFIDSHSTKEIINNTQKINEKLAKLNHYASIMLKYSLLHKSLKLQNIYIQSIVDELSTANNADLDSYFFGPLSIGYANSGDKLLTPKAKQIVVNYLKDIHYKYSQEGLNTNQNCLHCRTTAPYYFALFKNMTI